MLGTNSGEGVMFLTPELANPEDSLDKINDNWAFFGPYFAFDVGPTEEPTSEEAAAADAAKLFYFPPSGEIVGPDNLPDLVDYFTDTHFLSVAQKLFILFFISATTVLSADMVCIPWLWHSLNTFLRISTSSAMKALSPMLIISTYQVGTLRCSIYATYMPCPAYVTTMSMYLAWGFEFGPTHADELPFLFMNHSPESYQGDNWTDDDILVQKRILRLWTDFAKTGNPTPEDTQVSIRKHIMWVLKSTVLSFAV